MSITHQRRTITSEHPSGDPHYTSVDHALKRANYQQDALIEILYNAQDMSGYLDKELLTYIARQLKLPLSWVYGVASFYHYFSLEQQGEHSCVVCLGTACYVRQSNEIMANLQAEFGIKSGQTTTDGKLTLSTVRCPGNCGSAPILVVDGEVWGHLKPEDVVGQIRNLVDGASI
jgi:bidirectional [NiFe] hydrogenase diaphorase subunit